MRLCLKLFIFQALEAVVGVDANGKHFLNVSEMETVMDLRAVGDRWAEHVLENARAYIMSFIYIVFTVTTGWPLISTIGRAAGADRHEGILYFCKIIRVDVCICLKSSRVRSKLILLSSRHGSTLP